MYIVWTYAYYTIASWLISTATGVLTGIILWMLPKHPYLFVVDRILGIHKRVPDETSTSDIEENGIKRSFSEERNQVDVFDEIIDLRKSLYWRFFIWVLTTFTITLLWIVMFDRLILPSRRVSLGESCPDFVADCFVFQSQTDVTPLGPFNCIPKGTASNHIEGMTVCYGWVVTYQDMSDIIEVLGVCGGLLSIVGSIVPFVYYLSANENCFPCSILYGFIATAISGGIIATCVYFKISISFLTWFVLSLTAGLSLLASPWACASIRRKKKARKNQIIAIQTFRRPSPTSSATDTPDNNVQSIKTICETNGKATRRSS